MEVAKGWSWTTSPRWDHGGIVGKCNPGTRDKEAIYNVKVINRGDDSHCWAGVAEGPKIQGQMCGLIAVSCEMRSICTNHPGERGPHTPPNTQMQIQWTMKTRGGRRGERNTFIFWITCSTHSLKLKSLANAIHSPSFDTRLYVNITASGSQRKKNETEIMSHRCKKRTRLCNIPYVRLVRKIFQTKVTWQWPARS